MNEMRETPYNYYKIVGRLVDLTSELSDELDGVKVPASAAAILNAIRSVLNELSGDDE